MATKKRKDTPAAQSQRFIDMARKLGVSETERSQERAFGKVGLAKKPKKKGGQRPK